MYFYKVHRDHCSIEGDKLKTGTRGKIGGPSDGKIGVCDRNGKTAQQILSAAIADFEQKYLDENEDVFDAVHKQYPAETWFKYIRDRNPLLIVYLIDVASDEKESAAINAYRTAMTNPFENFIVPSVAIAMGFPRNDSVSQYSKKKYKANRVYNYFDQEYNYLEMEEEE